MGGDKLVGSEQVKKRRGRKPKGVNEEVQENEEQNKFFIDVSKEPESKEVITSILAQANNKSHGRKIILKDLVLLAIPKLTQKDIEKLQDSSLTEMEKVERALEDYNKKTDVKLSLGEFLVKKLGIN